MIERRAANHRARRIVLARQDHTIRYLPIRTTPQRPVWRSNWRRRLANWLGLLLGLAVVGLPFYMLIGLALVWLFVSPGPAGPGGR